MVVVLPAPFGPSRAVTCAGLGGEATRRRPPRARRSARRARRPRRRARSATLLAPIRRSRGAGRPTTVGRRDRRPPLRTDPDAVKAAPGAPARRSTSASVDRVVELDGRQRELEQRARRAPRPGQGRCRRRSAGCARDGDVDEAEALQAESRALGERRAAARRRGRRGVDGELRDLLLRIPNLPADDAPTARARTTTGPARRSATTPTRYGEHQRVPHWDIGAELGILDLERAVKISRLDVHACTAGSGATLRPGAVPARPRPQRRRLRGDPPADARAHRHA